MKTGSPLDVGAAFRFLRALSKSNNREWFEQHRAEYVDKIKPEFEDFVAGLLIAAAKFDGRFAHIEARRCIFRIYRDIRFSNDKTPYKTRLSAFLSPLGWRGTTPGFYVALEPGGESMIAAGIYTPQKPVLTDLRQRLADGDPAFERILRRKSFAPYLPLETDPLSRMPPGFDRDHPRGDLIRARRYMVRRVFSDVELRHGDAFERYRAALRDTAPLVTWLNASLGTRQTCPTEDDDEPLGP
jgi:uncharacterized protein (TIGR02453 family)